MSRAFYSSFVSHCLRFYSRHQNPVFRSEVDKNNWHACDSAIKTFTPEEKELLLSVYKNGDTISDNIFKISKGNGMKQDYIWNLVNNLERKVAKRRGLL